MENNQKVCLRPYIPRARHVFMRQRKPGQELVADTKKFCYLFLSSANVQTLRTIDADPDPYLSNDKVQYISLNESMKIGVLAAWSN